MTQAERDGLLAGLALLEAGFTDYGAHLLAEFAGGPGRPARRHLRHGQPVAAIQAIREALLLPDDVPANAQEDQAA